MGVSRNELKPKGEFCPIYYIKTEFQNFLTCSRNKLAAPIFNDVPLPHGNFLQPDAFFCGFGGFPGGSSLLLDGFEGFYANSIPTKPARTKSALETKSTQSARSRLIATGGSSVILTILG